MALLLVLLAPASVAAEDDALYMARLVARGFFRALADGEAAAMAPLCADVVSFDGQKVKGRKKIAARLKAMADRAQRANLRLKRVVVLTVKQAREKYGPPPERIKGELGKGRMVALAAFQRLGAVAVLARKGSFWRVVALTD